MAKIADRPEALFAEWAQMRDELAKLNDSRNRRLTAKAAVREASQFAGLDRPAVEKLRGLIDQVKTPHTWRFLYGALGVVPDIREGRNTRPLPSPLRLLCPPAVIAEAAAIGATVLGLQAVAWAHAAEHHPEAFGEWNGSDELQRRAAELKQKQDALKVQMRDARAELQRQLAQVDASLTEMV